MFEKSLHDLSKKIPNVGDYWKVSNLRSKVKIVSIDDEPFQPLVNLQNLGYNVTCIGDIKNVTEVEPYSIVLCDIMGVGLFFDANNSSGGTTIIKEIKNKYPSTFVIAYTGANLTSPEAISAQRLADHLISKDATIEEWQEVLSSFIKRATDPSVLWKRVRKRLVDEDVDTKLILKLESAYVTSILKKDEGFYNLRQVLDGRNLGGPAKSIITNLISSAIFAALAA